MFITKCFCGGYDTSAGFVHNFTCPHYWEERHWTIGPKPLRRTEPFKCPVCNGMGHISRPPFIPGDQLTWPSLDTKTYPCKACDGKGIVWSCLDKY